MRSNICKRVKNEDSTRAILIFLKSVELDSEFRLNCCIIPIITRTPGLVTSVKQGKCCLLDVYMRNDELNWEKCSSKSNDIQDLT
ncbi:hypothetical protein TNCV_325711 [Trichonephila clavipes]|nr:hypothetical protein TNCV_325711 [Trichonephila clavipes]